MTKTLTKTKVIRISETQHQTLVKMKSYNIDVGKFIRDAIVFLNYILYLYVSKFRKSILRN